MGMDDKFNEMKGKAKQKASDMAERTATYRRHNQKVANKRAGRAEEPEDGDDDRLRTAKSDEVPLELLEEPKAAAGVGGSGGPRPQQRRKKRR